MRGCLFILVAAAVAVALIVVVGLPAVAAGMVTAGVSAAGLQSDDTMVTVTSDPPTDLVGLHADRVRIRASDATFRGLTIGRLDVTLRDVGLVDRTAGSVEGELDAVVVPDVGAGNLVLDAIRISGGGDAVIATTTLSATQARTLISDGAAAQLGVRPSSVRLAAPDRLTVTVGGVSMDGRVEVGAQGDLVTRILSGPAKGQVVTLLRADSGLPIHLTSVTVTDAGALRLAGKLTFSLLG